MSDARLSGAVYVYEAEEPDTGWKGYIVELMPKGCGESGCAIYVLAEGTEADVDAWVEWGRKVLSVLDVEENIYDRVVESDAYVLTPDDLRRFKISEKPIRKAYL